MAERRVIVDTDPLATRDYASISLALAGEAKDLVALDRQLVIECRASTGVAETGLIDVTTAWITSPTCYLTIEVHPDHRHQGVWDDTKYRVLSGNTGTAGGGRVVKVRPKYSVVDGLQIQHTDPAGTYMICLDTDGDTDGLRARNLLMRDTRTDATHHRIGLDLRGGNDMRAENCVAYGFRAGSGTTIYCAGFFRDGTTVGADAAVFDNCTAYDCRRGFHAYGADSKMLLRNCAAVGNTLNGDFVTTNGSFDAGCSNNISSDLTAPGVSSLTSQVATDLFVAPATGDFNLKAGSNAINAGADLSSLFTTDIRGATRDSIFDIGAFEFGFAERRVIVDTDPLATRDYASLQAAVDGEAKDLVGLNRRLVFECRASSGLADGKAGVSGFTTSPECSVTVEVHPDHRHAGVWDDTKYRIIGPEENSHYNMFGAGSNTLVIGLQVENKNIGHSTTIDVGDVTNLVIRDTITRNAVLGTSTHKIGFIAREGANVLFQNCIAIGFVGTNSLTCGFMTYGQTTGLTRFQNCTAYDNRSNFLRSGGVQAAMLVENCLALVATATNFNGTMNVNSRNNAATGTNVPPGSGSFANLVLADTVVDAPAGNLALKTGSGAIDVGADLSSDFTTDILGNARPAGAGWDIGAFEFGASPPGPEPIGTKILCFGDSVTAGYPDSHAGNSYRWPMYEAYSAGGQYGTGAGQIRFVGPLDGLATGLEPVVGWAAWPQANSRHGGLGGQSTSQLAGVVQGHVATHDPDVILYFGAFINPGAVTEQHFRDLINNARAAKANIKFLFGLPYYGHFTNADFDQYRARLLTVIAELNTTTSPLRFVDQGVGWDSALHAYGYAGANEARYPNETGNALLAERWMDALSVQFQIGAAEKVRPTSDVTPGTWTASHPKTMVDYSPDLWLDAADSSTIDLVDTTRVSEFRDKSGNLRHFTQSTAANRPSISTAARNGRDVIAFNGTDQFMEGIAAVAGLARNTASYTVFYVVRATGTTPQNVIFLGNGLATGSARVEARAASDTRDVGGRRLDADTYQNHSVAAAQTSIACFVFDYTNALVTPYIDGVAGTPTAWQTAGSTSDTDSLATRLGASASSTQWLNGDIGEIVAFRRILTTGETEEVEGILAHKWGSQALLPSGHTYKHSPIGSLARMLNSPAPDDLTYVTSLALGTTRLALGPASLPASAERRLTYRAKGNAGLTVRLYQGAGYRQTVLHDAPIALWPMETDGVDIVGGRNLAVSGATFTAGGVLDGYLSMDGVDDYAEVASAGLVPTGDFSWQFWARVPAWTTGLLPTWMEMHDTIMLRDEWTTLNGNFEVWDGTTGAAVYPPQMPTNEWMLVTGTYRSSDGQMVVYSNKVGATPVTWAGSMPPRAITLPLIFGAAYNPTDSTRRRFARVDLSWAAIYDKTLTAAQIAAHHDAMTGPQSTLIATRSHALSAGDFTQYTMDLDAGEKAALTDGAELFVELEATAG